jgi:hypothetical protein
MKRILLIFTVLSIVSCSKKEALDYAVLSGKIENINGNIFSIRNSKGLMQDINVLPNGTFTDTIQNIVPGYYVFRYNNETASFYLGAGYNLNLSLDPNEFDESISYTGIGSNENNYLAQKFLKDEGLGKLTDYKYLGTLNENEYVKIADSI